MNLKENLYQSIWDIPAIHEIKPFWIALVLFLFWNSKLKFGRRLRCPLFQCQIKPLWKSVKLQGLGEEKFCTPAHYRLLKLKEELWKLQPRWAGLSLPVPGADHTAAAAESSQKRSPQQLSKGAGLSLRRRLPTAPCRGGWDAKARAFALCPCIPLLWSTRAVGQEGAVRFK